MVYKLNSVFRIVLMNTPQLRPDELEVHPYYSGPSVARWKGDARVRQKLFSFAAVFGREKCADAPLRPIVSAFSWS